MSQEQESDSGSSSGESLPRGLTKYSKRQRVISTTDSSDSSDSEVLPRRPRPNRRLVVSLLDGSSEDEDSSANRRHDRFSDTSNSSDEDSSPLSRLKSTKSNPVPTSPKSPHLSGNKTDSSEGNSEKCPICLLSFSNQNIGTPENCEHLFCADCITEWSKNVNTCPVDRLTFNNIVVRRQAGGKVIKTIPVSPRRPSEEEYFIEDTTYCEICHLSNSEETMLLCDSCDLGYHMHCLTPPLTEVPETEWFCPRCVRRNVHGSEEDEDELIRAIDLSNSEISLDLMSQIINATTETLNRINRVTRSGDPAPSTSGSTPSRRSRSGRTTQRNRTQNNTIIRRRRRQRRVRTRTVVLEYETRDDGKFPLKVSKKRIKRRRKKKKNSRAARTAARRALVRSSVRGRLTEQLSQHSPISERGNVMNTLAVPRLRLFDNDNALEYFDDSEIEDIEYGSRTGGVAVSVTSRSIASAILDSHRQVRRKMVSIPSPTYASTAPDILSTIMESQAQLHSKKSHSAKTPSITSDTKLPDTVLPDNITNKQVDVRNEDANSNVKEAPGYPGAGGGRGGGAWRGGQGGYQSHGQDNRGNYSNMSNDYQNNRGQDNSFQGNRSFGSPWQSGGPDNFQRREQFEYMDRSPLQRNMANMNRGRGTPLRFNQPQRPQHWQNQNMSDLPGPFIGPPPNLCPPLSVDMSSNPVDMTMSQDNGIGYNTGLRQSNYQDTNIYHGPQTVPPAISHTTPLPPPPQPPIIRFQRPPLSEDERSDTSQPDELEKYDPTEPTLDDSGSEDDHAPRSINITHNKITIVSPPRKSHPLVAEYGSGSESPREVSAPDGGNFSIDKNFEPHEPDVNDGCPNFSIYSSTLNIIKNNQSEVQSEFDQHIGEKEEDLVQQDDHCDENNMSFEADINLIPIPPEINKPTDNEDEELDDDWGDVSHRGNVEDQDQETISGQGEVSDKEKSNIGGQLDEIFDEPSHASNECLHKEIDSGKPIQHDNTEKVTSESLQSSGTIKTPQKRNSITIKLLPDRGISRNVFNQNDKDIENRSSSPVEDEKSSIVENDEVNTSADEEVKKISESDDFPDNIEKLTECISDVEDERSYTPCLDEKTKDTTLESEKEIMGIEGLDTEMISEDEGNDIFSDHNNQKTDSDGGALELSVRESELQPGEFEEGEIVEKQKIKERVKALLKQPNKDVSDDDKKKKRKEKKSEKDGKDKGRGKGKKNNEDTEGFKKLSKSNKERNYRDRDDKTKNKNKDKRLSRSPDVNKENIKDKENKAKDKRKEKRKDIERYDVRTIISERGRRVKDAFGRDTSRPRSKSQDSRLGSPKFRRSLSRRRSSSVVRRSFSRGRRSLSRVRRSPSRGRRSVSRRRRSVSRGRRSPSKRRRSGSRARSVVKSGRSVSPHRSNSPKGRRSVSPRLRKMRSPRRRSVSRGRSPIRKRSISPFIRRSKSPKIRRSGSRGKVKRGRRSPSRGKRMSPRLRRDSPPRRRLSRRSRSRLRSLSKNRSVSPKGRKQRKLKRHRSNSSKRKKSKSPHKAKQIRRRSQSLSPGFVISRSPSPNRANVQEPWVGEKSPLYREWSSRSRSPSLARGSPGWTPPPQRHKSPQPDNLRVILTTKDKSKKKEKKKKANKRLKATERLLQQQKDTGPCKEVFTSGNNILVSVSFNKNQENPDASEMPSTNVVGKKKKHRVETAKSKKDKNKEKLKKRRGDKNKRGKDDENKKPVAIIDLDKSPFKELTPSPKAVIVLSDSDNGEKEEELMERQEMIRGELLEMGFPQCDVDSPRRSPVRENVYVPPAGPKTPPEPAVKFTIANKANPQLRAVNPLHEDEEEEVLPEATEEKQETDKRPADATHKGPNTPPEPPNSPPSSPDAYDPFEPTRSGSATPERPPTPQLEKRQEDLLQVPSMSLEAAQKSNLSADDVLQARPISPMEKVLALLKSTRNYLPPASAAQPLYPEQMFDSTRNIETESLPVSQPTPVVTVQSPDKTTVAPTVTKSQVVSALVKPNSPKLIYSTVTPTVVTSTTGFLNPSVPRIPIYNTGTPPNPRIILPSPTKSSPLKMPTNKLFVGKPSPIKSTPIKPMPSKTIISKLPMPAIKPLPPRPNMKDKNKNGQNGNDIIELDLGMDSPYSPGSSDFGDLFDPPADNGKHTTNTYTPSKTNSTFDNLFSLKPSAKSAPKTSHAKNAVKQARKRGNRVGVRMDEDSLRILDELPNSAVELQVKTKFLKKLNRQERVVEEVKLVLKPHYSKKHISKEDYKEILRRAVPKICHSRSGEINPAKIHTLIEAYVRKFRKKAHMAK